MKLRHIAVGVLAVTGLLVPCSADEIADHAINTPANGWFSWGSVKTDVVEDASAQGGKYQRFTIAAKPANVWDIGIVTPTGKPVKKGDVILLAFWARAETPAPGDDFIEISGRVFETAPPQASITPQSNFTVGRNWKLFVANGVADKDYAAGALSCGILIGTAAQTLDAGPVYIADFGPGFDLSKLPQLDDEP